MLEFVMGNNGDIDAIGDTLLGDDDIHEGVEGNFVDIDDGESGQL